MAVESRGDLASRHGSIGRFAAAHSWSYRSDNPICTRTFDGLCCNFGRRGWQPEEIMKKAIRPAIFKWRQTEPELILCAVRWTLRDSL